jgi:hypothetical protein
MPSLSRQQSLILYFALLLKMGGLPSACAAICCGGDFFYAFMSCTITVGEGVGLAIEGGGEGVAIKGLGAVLPVDFEVGLGLGLMIFALCSAPRSHTIMCPLQPSAVPFARVAQ